MTSNSSSFDGHHFSSSLMTINSMHLGGDQHAPRIACAFINKRSGAKLGSAFLDVLNDLKDVQCNVHDLAVEDPEDLIREYIQSWATTPSTSGSLQSIQSSSHASKSALGNSNEGGATSAAAASKVRQQMLTRTVPCFPSVPVIMACGGDGTFSWIASTALKHAHDVILSKNKKMDSSKTTGSDAVLPSAPAPAPRISYCVVPFPLGTGNDMSGVLGWGRSLNANPSATKKLIESVELSSTGPKCDVWGVRFQNFHSMSRFNTMCNYFSIGADAKASRLFENHRTSRPKLYRSQSFNKASYAAFGGFLAFKGSSSLGKRIKRLIVDGKEIAVPPKAKALVVLNIPSYAGKPTNQDSLKLLQILQ